MFRIEYRSKRSPDWRPCSADITFKTREAAERVAAWSNERWAQRRNLIGAEVRVVEV